MAGSDHIVTETATAGGTEKSAVEKQDISQIERVMSGSSELQKDFVDYDRIDKDVAKYASTTQVVISAEENKRLKRMIDRRVLAIMIPTYFLQALDKGTMSL
jgi:type III secretory pathway component EscR